MTGDEGRRSRGILRPDWLIDAENAQDNAGPSGEEGASSGKNAQKKNTESKAAGSRRGKEGHSGRRGTRSSQSGQSRSKQGQISEHTRQKATGKMNALMTFLTAIIGWLTGAVVRVFSGLRRGLSERRTRRNTAAGAGTSARNTVGKNMSAVRNTRRRFGKSWEEEAQEKAQIRSRAISERSRDRREQQLRRRYVFLGIAVLLVILAVRGITYRAEVTQKEEKLEEELEEERKMLSAAVLGYEDMVRNYAEANDISEYVDILLAIMEVESKGLGNDVMQSSESMGLAAGSLEPEESISQACVYWKRLLKIADEDGCDLRSVIQAYNFGPGYLTYVAENNEGRYSEETAIEFAAAQSGGETVMYTNPLAIGKNGGWMYSYGNMFYEELVEQYLPDGWDE